MKFIKYAIARHTLAAASALLMLPLGASAITYVDQDSLAGVAATGADWPDAFDNLQDALECVRTGGCDAEIWAAAGVYRPDVGINQTADDQTESFYLVEGVRIYGGFDGIGAGGLGGALETLRSERDPGTNKTILSGDIGEDDIDINGNGVISNAGNIVGTNSEHVVYVDAVGLGTFTEATRLNGVYVTAGGGGSPGGGGFFCNGSAVNPCSPRLVNVIFRGNTALLGGAMYNLYSDAVLKHVKFTGNVATSLPGFGGAIYSYESDFTIEGGNCKNNDADFGGCIYNNQSNPHIDGMIFDGNTAATHGGAVFSDDSAPTVNNATFVDNSATGWGGAIFNINSQPVVEATGFYGNEASAGGAIANEINANFSGATSLVNVVFSGNEAVGDFGGALYNWNNIGGTLDISITNATFNRNSAVVAGGSIYNEGNAITGAGMDVTILNSIHWGSTDSIGINEIHVESGTVTLGSSDLDQLGLTGVTLGVLGTFVDLGSNIDAIPWFVSAAGADTVVGTLDDNLHLMSNTLVTSPAIDAGDNAAALALPTDFDGNPRIVDGDGANGAEVDMGAVEVQ